MAPPNLSEESPELLDTATLYDRVANNQVFTNDGWHTIRREDFYIDTTTIESISDGAIAPRRHDGLYVVPTEWIQKVYWTDWLRLWVTLWFDAGAEEARHPPMWKIVQRAWNLMEIHTSNVFADRFSRFLQGIHNELTTLKTTRAKQILERHGVVPSTIPSSKSESAFGTGPQRYHDGDALHHTLLKSKLYKSRSSSVYTRPKPSTRVLTPSSMLESTGSSFADLTPSRPSKQVHRPSEGMAREVQDDYLSNLHDERYLEVPESLFHDRQYMLSSNDPPSSLPILYQCTVGSQHDQITLHKEAATTKSQESDAQWRLGYRPLVPNKDALPSTVVRFMKAGRERYVETPLYRQPDIKHLGFYFPFPTMMLPQRLLVRQLLSAFMNKKHCLSESPTGTGKTLALLSAALAYTDWLRQRGVTVPKIYYLTRTHSQITQTIEEYKRTGWRVKMSVIGARQHSCPYAILDKQGGNVQAWCRSGRKGAENIRKKLMNSRDVKHALAELYIAIKACEDSGEEISNLLTSKDFKNYIITRMESPLLSVAPPSQNQIKRPKRVLPGNIYHHNDTAPTTIDLTNGSPLPDVSACSAAVQELMNRLAHLLDLYTTSVSSHLIKNDCCPFYMALGNIPKDLETWSKFSEPSAPEGVHVIHENPPMSYLKDRLSSTCGEESATDDNEVDSSVTQIINSVMASLEEANHCDVSIKKSLDKKRQEIIVASPADARVETSAFTLADLRANSLKHLKRRATQPSRRGNRMISPNVFPSLGELMAEMEVMESNSRGSHGSPDVTDIEDVGSFGVGPCPHYTSRAMALDADLIFAPYNMMIDPISRASANIDPTDAIIIFDEAHNLEGSIRENASYNVSSFDVGEMLKELLYMRSEKREITKQIQTIKNEISMFKGAVDQLANRLEKELPIGKDYMGEDRTIPTKTAGSEPKPPHVLYKWGIGQQLDSRPKVEGYGFLDELECMSSEFFYDDTGDIRSSNPIFIQLDLLLMHMDNRDVTAEKKILNASKFEARAAALKEILVAILNPSFPNGYVTILLRKYSLDGKPEWILRYDCMIAAVAFNDISSAAHSVVLGSGTLTPDSIFLSEFGKDWIDRLYQVHLPPERPNDPKNPKFCLHADHVIKDDQLSVLPLPFLIKHTNNNTNEVQTIPARFTFQTRNNHNTIASLGVTLVHLLTENVKGGVIIFVPSYDYLNTILRNWSSTQISANVVGRPCAPPICQLRPGTTILNALRLAKGNVFFEPKQGARLNEMGESEADAVLRQFKASIDSVGHGLLFGVYRGKFSEGISLSDYYCRMTICIGLPLPNIKDDNLLSKRRFNNALISGNWTPTSLESTLIADEPTADVDDSPSTGVRGDSESTEAREVTVNDQNAEVVTSKLAWLSGEEYYDMNAWVAINQAAGRTIRHLKDYGVIILLDARFLERQACLSQWLSPHIRLQAPGQSYLDYISHHINRVFHPARLSMYKSWLQQQQQETRKRVSLSQLN